MTLANIVCFMKISSCFKVENFEAGITETIVCKWAGKFNSSSVQNVLIASKIPNYYNNILKCDFTDDGSAKPLVSIKI